MDLISRISQHFTDSAQTKLDAVEMLAAPIAEAMLALVLIDHALRHRAQNADVLVNTPDIAKR